MTKPLPTDYIACTAFLHDLLVDKSNVVVVPLSYIKILKEMPSEDIRISKNSTISMKIVKSLLFVIQN